MKDDINMDEQGQMSSDMETLLGTNMLLGEDHNWIDKWIDE